MNRKIFIVLVTMLGTGSALAQPLKCDPFPNDPPKQIACLHQMVGDLKKDVGDLKKEIVTLKQQITDTKTALGNAVTIGLPVNILHRRGTDSRDECLTGTDSGGGILRDCKNNPQETFTIRRIQ